MPLSSQILPSSANEYNIEKYEKRLHKLDFEIKNKLDMEVLAVQKSVLDGMKNELKALLELTENARCLRYGNSILRVLLRHYLSTP